MVVKATQEKKQVFVDNLAYVIQGSRDPETGDFLEPSYQSCFYDVIMDDAILADWDPSKLNVRITHKHPSLSAYIY